MSSSMQLEKNHSNVTVELCVHKTEGRLKLRDAQTYQRYSDSHVHKSVYEIQSLKIANPEQLGDVSSKAASKTSRICSVEAPSVSARSLVFTREASRAAL